MKKPFPRKPGNYWWQENKTQAPVLVRIMTSGAACWIDGSKPGKIKGKQIQEVEEEHPESTWKGPLPEKATGPENLSQSEFIKN